MLDCLELVEVNPIRDHENTTAKLAVGLAASALGVRILEGRAVAKGRGIASAAAAFARPFRTSARRTRGQTPPARARRQRGARDAPGSSPSLKRFRSSLLRRPSPRADPRRRLRLQGCRQPVGLLVYGIVRVSYDAYYSRLGVFPEAVGLTETTILGRAVLYLALTASVGAILGGLWFGAVRLGLPRFSGSVAVGARGDDPGPDAVAVALVVASDKVATSSSSGTLPITASSAASSSRSTRARSTR